MNRERSMKDLIELCVAFGGMALAAISIAALMEGIARREVVRLAKRKGASRI